MRHLNQRGLTLVELMVCLTIAIFLAVTAAPYFGDYTANARLREGGHLLYGEALAAQSEAVKRNATMRLSAAGATIQVIDRSDPANPVTLRERTLPEGLQATTATVDFRSTGLSSSGSIDVTSVSGTCSADLRCPGLRVDAGGAVRLCADKTATGC